MSESERTLHTAAILRESGKKCLKNGQVCPKCGSNFARKIGNLGKKQYQCILCRKVFSNDSDDQTAVSYRKDKMRQGYVARTVHIPIDLDDRLKMMALKNHIRISDEAIVAFKEHISRSKN